MLFTSTSECRRTPRGECTLHRKTTVNKTILLLIGIELFFASIFAVVGPFISIFITRGVPGVTMSAVGIATMIFLVSKSTLQLPLSRLVDAKSSENAVVCLLSGGYALTALGPLSLAFSSLTWQIFLSQFLIGLGSAVTYPSWNALFTHHIDKEQTAFEWSMYDTVVGYGGAAAAAVGGALIDWVGFRSVYLGVGMVILLSSLSPLFFYQRAGEHHHARE
jgi:MFS family permease